MQRDPPLVRQWQLLRALAARRYGATVQEMAAEFAVATKTIRRDLNLLLSIGLPLEETVVEHGQKQWRMRPNVQPEMSFTWDEALALYLGRRLLDPLSGTLLGEAAQRAFRKVRACLGRPALAYLEKMAAHLYQTHVGASDYSHKAELIDSLLQAIEDRRQTIITYQSLKATEPVEYAIEPYGVVFHRGSRSDLLCDADRR